MLPRLDTVAPHCCAAATKVDGTAFASVCPQYAYFLYRSSCMSCFCASVPFSTLASILATVSFTSGPQAVAVCANAVENCEDNAANPITANMRVTLSRTNVVAIDIYKSPLFGL